MIGWLIFAGYMLGWLVMSRTLMMRAIDNDARQELENRRTWPGGPERHYRAGRPLVSIEDKLMAVVMALMVSIAWPLVIPVYLVARSLKTPTEKREDQRVELEALRKQAREYGLDLGDGK